MTMQFITQKKTDMTDLSIMLGRVLKCFRKCVVTVACNDVQSVYSAAMREDRPCSANDSLFSAWKLRTSGILSSVSLCAHASVI
jgi:hypothetical protein